MAQQLYDRHSVKVHLSTVKRHIRLTRHIKGAEELGSTIEPFYTELVTKSANANTAAEETEFKHDLLLLKDALLDDKVRDVHEAAKKYDRDHPGLAITTLLFPEGPSSIIYAPIESEPTLVEKLILRIQNLGEAHPLAEQIAPLQTAIDESKAAIEALHTAITAEKMADALTAIAKVNLTRQYEQNIYAAGSKYGKTFANRLFPAINQSSKVVPDEETDKPAK